MGRVYPRWVHFGFGADFQKALVACRTGIFWLLKQVLSVFRPVWRLAGKVDTKVAPKPKYTLSALQHLTVSLSCTIIKNCANCRHT